MTDYTIPREVIARVFPVPRDTYAFERLTSRFGEVEANSTVAVASTNALADATFVTLSANAELPNERVLQFGTGLAGQLTDTTITLGLTNAVPRVTGGDRLTFEVTAQSVLEAPATGFLATREWVGARLSNVRAVSASDSYGADDYLILANAGGGAVTLSLPAAAASAGRRVAAKKTDATGNAVTVDADGADTIDGAGSKAITAQYGVIELVCDGVGWWQV